MRYYTFVLLAVALTGCAPNSPTSHAKSFRLLQGTWQWIRFDQTQVHDPFYIRFYSDGRAATWPALKERVYQIQGNHLIVRAGTGQNYARVKFQLKDNELTMIGPHTNRFIYHRVVPDLRPGQFLPGQANRDITPSLIIGLLTPDTVPQPAPTTH